MKFCWFHLMPYRFLPKDFEKDYHSVWVDVPSRLFDPAKGHQLYNEFLDELEFADQMGFDGICVNEHHNNAYGIMPAPNVIAGALARRTSDAALIVLGSSIALYNPPLRAAEELAMLGLHQRREAGGGPAGGQLPGHEFRLRTGAGDPAGEVLRGPRPRQTCVDRAGAVRVQRGSTRRYAM